MDFYWVFLFTGLPQPTMGWAQSLFLFVMTLLRDDNRVLEAGLRFLGLELGSFVIVLVCLFVCLFVWGVR